MTTKDEFYHWWSGLTNDERVNCWYDLDAMAHGEVLVALRDKLATAVSRIATLESELAEAKARAERTRQLSAVWRERGMYATNIRALPGPAPESIAYYNCAQDLETLLGLLSPGGETKA